MDIYKFAVVWGDDEYHVEQVVGTEERVRDFFSRKWMEYHNSDQFSSQPKFMELWRADDPDGEAIARYEFHMEATNG